MLAALLIMCNNAFEVLMRRRSAASERIIIPVPQSYSTALSETFLSADYFRNRRDANYYPFRLTFSAAIRGTKYAPNRRAKSTEPEK